METFELRYFLAVARTENLHRASEDLRVSPASLSKAVARLEHELSTRLFAREGRRLRLTEPGRRLKTRAADILRLEEAARVELGGSASRLHATIAGPEVLLAHFGFELAAKIRRRHPAATIDYQACSDAEALARVREGDVPLALVSQAPPRGLTSRKLSETRFQTVAGPGHPLYARARAGRAFAVAEVLTHGFVSASQPWFGVVGAYQSLDGWRDDEFPRRIEHRTSSLKLLERLLLSGQALAYVPDYLARELGLVALKISGCPYRCEQTIAQVARKPRETGWLAALFD